MLQTITSRNSSRRRRRALVVLMYLGTACIPGILVPWGAFAPSDTPVGVGAAYLLSLLLPSAAVSCLLFATFRALRASTQEVAVSEEGDIDERQREVRDGAYRKAYNILLVAMLPVLATVLALGLDWIPPWLDSGFVAMAVCFTYLWLMATLPTAVLAWEEPDAEPEDD